jgi:hypothetical protein
VDATNTSSLLRLEVAVLGTRPGCDWRKVGRLDETGTSKKRWTFGRSKLLTVTELTETDLKFFQP